MKNIDSINTPFVSYPDYKKFQNILTDSSVSVKDFINPINFFIPSELKVGKIDKESFIKSLFSLRIVRLPRFKIIDEQIERYSRFEDYTKKDEVNNIALWLLSAFRYLSTSDLRLGKELEINQENNPRDGRLDVVAIRDKQICIIETKTDLRSLLAENRFTYQINGYCKECLKYADKYLKSKDLLVLLAIGGEETDLFPPDHEDCTTGRVGNISKIFYDKSIKENVKFISANAIWSLVAYQYLIDKELDLLNFIRDIFAKQNVIGLLSAGIIKNNNGKIEIEKINLSSF
jgi:hypothetical protein